MVGTMSSKTTFENGLRAMGFHIQDGTWINSNRVLAYDNDCSDDKRDDGFYESRTVTFNAWANPICDKIEALAKNSSIKIKVTTSAEYGDIYVEVD